MRRAYAVLALTAALLTAAAAPAADTPAGERARLIIESGRLVVMMDQGAAALKLLHAGAAHGDLDAGVAERAYAFQELVAAVLHYNLLQQRACRAAIVARALCKGPYLPDWLKDLPGKDHGESELRRMTGAVSHRLTPFWTALCDEGGAAAHDESFCALE